MALNRVAFNTDYSRFSFTTDTSFLIYDTMTTELCFMDFIEGGTEIASQLNSSSFVALRGTGNDEHLSKEDVGIWNDDSKAFTIKWHFVKEVLDVKITKDWVITVLIDKVYIHDMQDDTCSKKIKIFPNEHAPIALAQPKHLSPILAIGGPAMGEVYIYVLGDFFEPLKISAHENPISVMALNQDGTLLCTASEKGTCIRVFDASTGVLVHEFRRGLSPSEISSIAFNEHSTALVVSSSSTTIHIYHLPAEGEQSENQISNILYYTGLSSWSSQWSSKQIRTDQLNTKCCFGHDDENLIVISIGGSGKYCRYSKRINSDEDFECVVDKQIRWDYSQ